MLDFDVRTWNDPLPADADCRLPDYRVETFLRFYAFHLRYQAHPGAVYYVMPFLRDRYDWSDEEAIWFAVLNGNTQHPLTSLLLFQAGPEPTAAAVESIIRFWRDNYDRLAFDTDRRWQKKHLDESLRGLLELCDGDVAGYFHAAAACGWRTAWYACRTVPTFGRLSAFSFAEYLRIMGVDFDCEDLMVGDLAGSKSHRNGLAIVSGNESWDWHKSNPSFDGRYTPDMIDLLSDWGAALLAMAKRRMPGVRDVSYFTLESTLCTYKGWHRVNRRYPNCYNDMFYDRIRKTEADWPEWDTSVFWEARAENLPSYLRLEESPGDPGLVPLKQNYYRQTGRPIMMHRVWPEEFSNDFNTAVDECAWGRYR